MLVTDFSPIIEIIEENYEVPHLNATRRISALLPYDYYESDRRYPVLYLQDGQNLFNPDAPFGDWAIDRSMESLASSGLKDIIIIAVDHGKKERIIEYFPYYNNRFGQGKGRHYVQFMKEKLIPYVNTKYRTLRGFSNTGIGGSSMGGLISLYAGLSRPKLFGKMMIFSPSLWTSSKIYEEAYGFKPTRESKIYVYAGGKESAHHLPNVKRLTGILKSKTPTYSNFAFKVVINEDGEHSETYWKDEFPKALKWLYFNISE